MLNTIVRKIQNKYNRYITNKSGERQEEFYKSLNAIQKVYFGFIKNMLSGYGSYAGSNNLVCYKQDDRIVIETDVADNPNFRIFCSIVVRASECMVYYSVSAYLVSDADGSTIPISPTFKLIKHVEIRYFDTNAGFIFDTLLDQCLKRKRENHEEAVKKLLV